MKSWIHGITVAAAVVLASSGASAVTFSEADCGQLADQAIKAKKLMDEIGLKAVQDPSQLATKQDVVQLVLVSQVVAKSFSMLAAKCPAALAGIKVSDE